MFAYKQVCLEQISYALPPCVVPSVELERSLAPIYERFGLHEGRLELMTGIKERRFWEEGAAPSDGSTLAGQQALAASDLAPDDIECLIHASVSRDFLEPATASVVHHNLHLPPRSLMYDISNACLGRNERDHRAGEHDRTGPGDPRTDRRGREQPSARRDDHQAAAGPGGSHAPSVQKTPSRRSRSGPGRWRSS